MVYPLFGFEKAIAFYRLAFLRIKIFKDYFLLLLLYSDKPPAKSGGFFLVLLLGKPSEGKSFQGAVFGKSNKFLNRERLEVGPHAERRRPVHEKNPFKNYLIEL